MSAIANVYYRGQLIESIDAAGTTTIDSQYQYLDDNITIEILDPSYQLVVTYNNTDIIDTNA